MADTAAWPAGTANTIPEGRLEVGPFFSLRYGLSHNRQVSARLLSPSLGIKKRWGKLGRWTYSSQHTIYYPTPILRLVTKEGTFGFTSPEFDIPYMVSFSNGILFTQEVFPEVSFTCRAAFAFSVGGQDLDPNSTIDLPVVFPRLAVYYHAYSFRFGGNVLGRLSDRLAAAGDSEWFLIPRGEESFALEFKGLLIWNKSERFGIIVGYMLTYGEYPFGTQLNRFPVLGFRWGWQLSKKD